MLEWWEKCMFSKCLRLGSSPRSCAHGHSARQFIADGTLAAGVGLTGYYIYAFASPMFAADDALVAAVQ